MKNIIITVLVVITLCPQFSYAKEIYEENGEPMMGVSGIAGGDDIFVAKDLEIPKERISSIDVNENGELLVTFRSKIMVFDNEYNPIKAYDIWFAGGDAPANVWNDKTGRIVYVRGDGYEINDEGDVVYFYGNVEEEDYFYTKAEWNGVKYRLENRIPLGNPTGSYSTLIMTDGTGEETVLHNAIFSQLLIDLAVWLTIIILVIAGIKTLIWRLKEDKKTEEELAKEAEEETQREIEAMEIAERESKKAAENITNKYK